MDYIKRAQEEVIQNTLRRGKSVLLLGARQTGKTTLINRIKADLLISFVRPDIRHRYEKDPAILVGEIDAIQTRQGEEAPLVILDEVQKVPAILDVVQDLIDRGKAKFVLTGSSARKLRHGTQTNLLPGRLVMLKLDPLTLTELPAKNLNERLLYGALPGILSVERERDRETDLESYVTVYLEEEVRAEAVVRNLGAFARFLELAASESGNLINLRKLSQEIGVAHTTIDAYYQILEDCLITERIDPITKSRTRKKLIKSAKYLFFDLGVRRVAAREGVQLSREMFGHLFEQFVGLELMKAARLSEIKKQIRFWRDPDGPEVDWVIESEGVFTPVEVKWTNTPHLRDVNHLEVFLSEHDNAAKGFLICQIPRRMNIGRRVTALPWQEIAAIC